MKITAINGLRVDLDAIQSIAHRFDPARCSGVGCCCSTYEVSINRKDLRRAVDWLPLAAEFQPGLLDYDGPINPFEPIEDDSDGRKQWALETDENCRCVFAYDDADGVTLCSLHAAALKRGEDPFQVKPQSCTLWPLALTTDEPPLLTVMDDALDFPCNHARAERGSLDAGIAEIVESLFGHDMLLQIEADL